MKNISFVSILLYSCSLFSQQSTHDICPQLDPSIMNVDPIPTFVPETFTNQPPSPPPPPPGPGDRIIFWIHGLGGDAGSWSVAADEVRDTRAVTSLLPTYSEFSLDVAGGELHDNQLVPLGVPSMIANETEDPMNNFIIAHSQGGLVSRATDAFYLDEGYADKDRMFGGIVTFGTPHGGAQIINSIPDIIAFGDISCLAITAGPAEEEFKGDWFLDLIIPDDAIEAALGQLCNFVSNQVLPIALSDFQAGITDDYAVGSPVITALNNVPSTIPRVAFHGIEDDPVIWRTLFSLQNNPNNFPVFQADDDQEMVDWANENTLSYEMKYLAYDALYTELSNGGCNWWQWIVLNVGCFIDWAFDDLLDLDDLLGFGEDDAIRVRNAYYQGWQWWLNADESYQTLIGAIEYQESSTNYQCECTQEDIYSGSDLVTFFEFTVDDPNECDFTNNEYINCQVYEVTNFTRIEHPSDGVVLASSAMAYPGADVGPDNAMYGSNHQQMRNDSNLEEKLNELFLGLHGDYFITN